MIVNTLNESLNELVKIVFARDLLDLLELGLVGLHRVLFAFFAPFLGRLGLLLLAPRYELFVFLSLLSLDLHELFELLVVVNNSNELFQIGVQLHFVLVLLVTHEHHLGLGFLALIVRRRRVFDHFRYGLSKTLMLFLELFVQLLESVAFYS